MDRRGQITLELVVMLVMVVTIFLFVSNPMADISNAATRSVGVSALASKTVDSIVQKANLVALSGSDARDYLEIQIIGDFDGFYCQSGGNSVSLAFNISNQTKLNQTGVLGLVANIPQETKTYSSDGLNYKIGSCNLSDLDTGSYSACICFEDGGWDAAGHKVKIAAYEMDPGSLCKEVCTQ